MSQPQIEYEPSPAHKYGTTVVGPPTWNPSKEKCPEDLTVSEREELLRYSLAPNGRADNPRRYAVRRAGGGTEFYESKLTVVKPDGTIVVHGHPTRRVPPAVLRQMRDDGLINQTEYRRFLKELG
jgi:hypothetical protein